MLDVVWCCSHFLAQRYPNFSFTGFDVSPQLPAYCRFIKASKSQLSLSDFSSLADCYDLILLIDVLEHLRDPLTFIETIAPRSKYFLFPSFGSFRFLCYSFFSTSFIRSSVGHLHSFTRELALQTLIDAGLTILPPHILRPGYVHPIPLYVVH